MAVLRESAAPQGALQDTRRYSAPQISQGNVQPDYVRTVGDQSWRQNMIGNLVNMGNNLVSKYVDNELTNAYLKGSAQAELGKVETELETDPFTKNWQVAGFRDNMGRLTHAKQEADLAKDMQWLREKSPEEMSQYLAKQRNELLPVLEGMSGEMRSKMIPTMALRDQAALQNYKTQHQQHIWDVTGKTLTQGISQGITQLGTIKEMNQGGDAYIKQTQSVMAGIIDMRTSNLPQAQKDILTQEVAELALTQGHTGLYLAMRDAVVPDYIGPNGKMTSNGLSMLESLPVPTQEKLSKAFQTAEQASNALAHQDFRDNFIKESAALDNGVSTLDHAQWKAILDTGSRLKIISPEQRDKAITRWEDAQFKRNDSLVLGQAFLSNNTSAIYQHPKGMSGAEANAKELLAKMPLPVQIQTLANSVALGNTNANKLLGERMNPTLMALQVTDGKMTPEHAEALAQIHSTMDALEKDQKLVPDEIYRGMSDTAKMRLMRLRELNKDGQTGAAGVAAMLRAEEKHSSYTEQEKAVLAQDAVRADEKFLTGIGGQGLFSRTADRVMGVFSRDSALRYQMEGKGVVPDADPAAQAKLRDAYVQTWQSAVRDEMRSLALQGANSAGSSEARAEAAMAAVINRTVSTGHGAMIVPRGQTVQKYFGVADATPPSLIDSAIANHPQFKATAEGGWVQMDATPQGIRFQEFDRNAIRVPGRAGIVKPGDLAPAIEAQKAPNRKLIQDTMGAGVPYSSGGIMFNYNGVNTAGVSEIDMLKFRKNLIQNEGVRSKPYDDATGKELKAGDTPTGNKTIGVGIAHESFWPETRPDGSVSNEAIAASFIKASNNAALQAVRTQESTGIKNSASFQLFAEFTYRGKGNFKQFEDAIKTRDESAALEALKKTTAYSMSKATRRKHYETLTIAALKG